jgi:hypothetical protein
MFPIDFEVKRSSALDIKVEIRFPGSKQLSLPPRVTIAHIDYPWKENVPY